MKSTANNIKLGIIGTGFFSRSFIASLNRHHWLTLGMVLTRRNPLTIHDLGVTTEKITNDVEALIAASDVIIEASGDTVYAAPLVERILKAGKTVITMNAELQLTCGTALAKYGTLVEGHGDQPGVLAAFDAEVRAMGFRPLVYGNIKKYLNLNPSRVDMEFWAAKQGISLTQVTGFTDGSKVQLEQALVANGLRAGIVRRGMLGITADRLEPAAMQLAELVEKIGTPISDYVITGEAPGGVFIVAKHSSEQRPMLEYLKLGNGPYYLLVRPFHLCHLELPLTIAAVTRDQQTYRFNNGAQPTIQVYAVAKRDLRPGESLPQGFGSFDVRGEAAEISEYPHGIPLGLCAGATVTRPIQRGRMITFDDVLIPDSRAKQLWSEAAATVTSKSKIYATHNG